MVRQELGRLLTWSERHRRLLARLMLVFLLTLLVDMVGTVFAWRFEEGVKGSDIHSFGDAAFFATVQILTVSSSLMNPVTSAGKVLDVVLEAWAVLVVTAVAGSFATFFQVGDTG